ncbi:ABC transporter substrate-binding protein [Paeniglutamicibacter psychrophenolicus]|uniref:ABC transporter substrate-binding protein n=1 Tax=Paeniglutamicibacter psychrophenolicus TaxID=257454 RepID=UPI00278AA127|nr:ABC transporter substrate-binding protein [Paeniglutamicibacter psychrophenolicus]MDQ0093814.1 peptide/nickel transport system substrate-binding protein [Paeniglutamicibacter psychrophenolicus]
MRNPQRLTTLAILASILLVGTGCAPAAPGSGREGPAQPSLALLTAALPETLNPLAGFDNNGTGKINESLYTLTGSPDHLPQITPLLAADEPTVSADARTWTVPLRQDARFSDGTTFDAADVVASYKAIMDPASASPVLGTLSNVVDVKALDPHTVEFTLRESQVSFKTAMLIGIAPSETIEPGQRVEESTLNRKPVGTGPYLVDSIGPSRLVLVANPEYRDGEVALKRVTYEAAPDDNARAQRMLAGEFDGTVLPPRLAATFAANPAFEQVTATSADWRGLSLPADNPLTSDPKVRLALNLGVDRQGLVDGVLAGTGRPAHTFVPAEYGDAFDPAAVFAHDPARAAQLLDEAGWVLGDDSMRSKDGAPAAFTLMYNPGDQLRRDLSLAFSAQMKQLGIDVPVEAATFEMAEPRVGTDAIMLGGGDTPYDVDTQLYKMLHSSYPATGAYYDNPSRFADPAMDRALETGRTTLDEAKRAAAYREVARLYVTEPSMVLLAFIDHTYIQRTSVSEAWTGTGTLLEPHDHGTAWGPWVKIGQWVPKQ